MCVGVNQKWNENGTKIAIDFLHTKVRKGGQLAVSSQNSVASPIINPQSQAMNVLSQMGIHQTNLGGLLGKLNTMLVQVYQSTSSFTLSYGAMFLVIGAFAWLIAWKFHAVTMQGWAKRVVFGVFIAEVIVVLLPQVYFGLLSFLSRA